MIRHALGLAVGCAFLLGLSLLVEWQAVVAAFKEANPALLLAGISFHAFSLIFLQALRFRAVIANGIDFLEAGRITLIAQLYAQFLPTVAGGDAIRAFLLSRMPGFEWKSAVGATAIYRLSGLAIIFLLPFLSLLFGGQSASILFTEEIVDPGTKGAALFVLLILLCASVLWLRRNFLRKKLDPFLRPAIRLRAGNWFMVFAYALCFHLMRALCIGLYLYVFGGGSLEIFDILFVITASALSGLLPISFGGIGVVEGVLAGALVFFEVAAPVAVSVAIANRIAIIFSAMMGLPYALCSASNRDVKWLRNLD